MKKVLTVLLAMLVCGVLLAGCGGNNVDTTPPAEEPAPAQEAPAAEAPPAPEPEPEITAAPYLGELMMATTTSTDNTGLLDYLAPVFLFDTGWDLKWIAVGSGEAIQLGRDGEVDVLLVHSKAAEESFVEDGFGIERIEVMYNDYVIVGPPDGPVAYSNDAVAVFKQIMDESLIFVSRGDDSGTHNAEKKIWKTAEIENFESNPNYVSAGAGMGATILMADEMMGYCLADRGTWLSTKKNTDNDLELEVICEGDKALFNQYSIIAVSPDKYPDVLIEAANAFIMWMCSAEIQELIGKFGIEEYGEPLFVPNAK
jgi:tungstate transport system substrate-binding protein